MGLQWQAEMVVTASTVTIAHAGVEFQFVAAKRPSSQLLNLPFQLFHILGPSLPYATDNSTTADATTTARKNILSSPSCGLVSHLSEPFYS